MGNAKRLPCITASLLFEKNCRGPGRFPLPTDILMRSSLFDLFTIPYRCPHYTQNEPLSPCVTLRYHSPQQDLHATVFATKVLLVTHNRHHGRDRRLYGYDLLVVILGPDQIDF